MLLVELADNGCGIPPEIQQNLFTPFFTTKARGSGLGLAISHKIIKEHRGRCIIKSVVGRGTAVRVYLPVHAGLTGKLLQEDE
jgi:signal transduction histidine kinase